MRSSYIKIAARIFFTLAFIAVSCALIWATSNDLLPRKNDPDYSLDQSEPFDISPVESTVSETSYPTPEPDFSTYLTNIKNESDYPDYKITDAVFDKDTTVFTFAREAMSPDSINSLVPRMGYLFLTHTDGSVSLLDSTGEVIFNELPAGYEFAGVRDAENRPLFMFEDKYYYLEGKEFIAASYDSERDGRGIEFDYPSYYGAPDGIHEKFKYGYYWGMRYTQSKNTAIYPYFNQMYNYSEGVCVGVYYNTLQLYDSRHILITKDYLPPLTTGIESLGYFYFDHGLIRVRAVENGESKEYLMYEDATLFTIPTDFELVNYYNGVIVLKKDERYGYMRYTGEWLTDPVYTYAAPFIEGVAVFKTTDEKYGLLDINGHIILPPVFDYISDCSGGVIVAYEEEHGYYIINKIAKTDTELEFDESSAS